VKPEDNKVPEEWVVCPGECPICQASPEPEDLPELEDNPKEDKDPLLMM